MPDGVALEVPFAGGGIVTTKGTRFLPLAIVKAFPDSENLVQVKGARDALGSDLRGWSELYRVSPLNQTTKKKQKLSLSALRCCHISFSLCLMRASRSSRAQ